MKNGIVRDVAVIILVNEKGEFLLQKRSSSVKRAPGKWGFFGGGIEKNETSLDAVKRETLEELHYELTNPKLIFTRIINEGDTIYVYREDFDASQELILGEGEAYDV